MVFPSRQHSPCVSVGTDPAASRRSALDASHASSRSERFSSSKRHNSGWSRATHLVRYLHGIWKSGRACEKPWRQLRDRSEYPLWEGLATSSPASFRFVTPDDDGRVG